MWTTAQTGLSVAVTHRTQPVCPFTALDVARAPVCPCRRGASGDRRGSWRRTGLGSCNSWDQGVTTSVRRSRPGSSAPPPTAGSPGPVGQGHSGRFRRCDSSRPDTRPATPTRPRMLLLARQTSTLPPDRGMRRGRCPGRHCERVLSGLRQTVPPRSLSSVPPGIDGQFASRIRIVAGCHATNDDSADPVVGSILRPRGAGPRRVGRPYRRSGPLF
jgi:hypothetical protein